MQYFAPDNPYFIAGAVFVFFICVFFPLVFTLLGKLIYWLGFKKIGHYLVAVYSPYDIWLIDKCPYYMGERCYAWTCPAYDKYHRHFCWNEHLPF